MFLPVRVMRLLPEPRSIPYDPGMESYLLPLALFCLTAVLVNAGRIR